MSDRKRAEFLRVHLAEPARLEARRHQREVAAGENPPRLGVIEADIDANGIRPAPMRFDKGLLDFRLSAAGDDDLSARIDDFVGGGPDEIDAFLMNQTSDQPEDRTAGHR